MLISSREKKASMPKCWLLPAASVVKRFQKQKRSIDDDAYQIQAETRYAHCYHLQPIKSSKLKYDGKRTPGNI
jgi:hypothetical protein